MHRRHRVEQHIHKAVVEHLKVRGVDGLVYLHPANGGARTAVEGAILKGVGVVPGAPDLLLWCNGRSYAMELKAEPGRVTESQLEMLNRLSQAGCYTAICHGLDRALTVLEAWQLLQGRIQ